jgi:hypothetical protein
LLPKRILRYRLVSHGQTFYTIFAEAEPACVSHIKGAFQW